MIKPITTAQAVLYRRRVLEKHKFEYRQNNNAICIFRHFRPTTTKNLFIKQQSRNNNSKTLLQIKGYHLLP